MNLMQPQAFDVYAQQYDEHFTNSLIGKAQRSQVYRQLLKTISAGIKHVLEVNCGTGQDAVWLAQQGMDVLATDVSEGMLAVARQKAGKQQIRFKQLKSQEISTLQPAIYDLIFSNFGGLNCLDASELTAFKNGCGALQMGADRLVLVVMSNGCWWEKSQRGIPPAE
jgi:ubiquinone/menaquinone biosynthesis C-methylase UbiE